MKDMRTEIRSDMKDMEARLIKRKDNSDKQMNEMEIRLTDLIKRKP